jgi:hypothetical protein
MLKEKDKKEKPRCCAKTFPKYVPLFRCDTFIFARVVLKHRGRNKNLYCSQYIETVFTDLEALQQKM